MALVARVAGARGWKSSIVARDADRNRYATMTVCRTLPTDMFSVAGAFELTSDPKGSISYRLSTMHDHGFDDLVESITTEFMELPWFKPPLRVGRSRADSMKNKSAAIDTLTGLLRRFHVIAKQLRQRHDDRAPFLINDEYDLQDVLHAILRGLFDDVRAEEYSPSYAGGASRVDFLLKNEKLAIEVKLASSRLRDKQVGEQLLVDIGRYREHPDCQTLVCFIYDPTGQLRNPSGLEVDLTGDHGSLRVAVIVVSI